MSDHARQLPPVFVDYKLSSNKSRTKNGKSKMHISRGWRLPDFTVYFFNVSRYLPALTLLTRTKTHTHTPIAMGSVCFFRTMPEGIDLQEWRLRPKRNHRKEELSSEASVCFHLRTRSRKLDNEQFASRFIMCARCAS